MNKWILFCLLAVSSQIYGVQHSEDSTYAFADALIWKLRESSAENWAQQITPVGAIRTANLLGMPFKMVQARIIMILFYKV